MRARGRRARRGRRGVRAGRDHHVAHRRVRRSPGHFRVAFDADGDDGFVDPVCLAHCDVRLDPVGPTFAPSDDPNVLLDLAPDTDGGASTLVVTLPDVTCERCTLQVIQVMYDKRPYTSPGNDIYYQCADIALRAPAVEPAVEPTVETTVEPAVEPAVEATPATGSDDDGCGAAPGLRSPGSSRSAPAAAAAHARAVSHAYPRQASTAARLTFGCNRRSHFGHRTGRASVPRGPMGSCLNTTSTPSFAQPSLPIPPVASSPRPRWSLPASRPTSDRPLPCGRRWRRVGWRVPCASAPRPATTGSAPADRPPTASCGCRAATTSMCRTWRRSSSAWAALVAARRARVGSRTPRPSCPASCSARSWTSPCLTMKVVVQRAVGALGLCLVRGRVIAAVVEGRRLAANADLRHDCALALVLDTWAESTQALDVRQAMYADLAFTCDYDHLFGPSAGFARHATGVLAELLAHPIEGIVFEPHAPSEQGPQLSEVALHALVALPDATRRQLLGVDGPYQALGTIPKWLRGTLPPERFGRIFFGLAEGVNLRDLPRMAPDTRRD